MLRLTSVTAVVLLSAGTAWGQTPFVENHLVPNAAWMAEGPFDYVNLPASERELTLPAGTVLISWTCTMSPDLQNRVRPRIDDDVPAEGANVRGFRSSGSWLTTTEGGTVTVGLQVKSVFTGTVIQLENIDSLSWSIQVFPEGEPVPAVSTLGLALMVALLLGAGAYVLRKRVPLAA